MSARSPSYIVYILQCKDGSLYTGITTDIKRRFQEHRDGKGAHYTKVRGVKKILFTERHRGRSAASKREAAIKKLARKEKLDLIRLSR